MTKILKNKKIVTLLLAIALLVCAAAIPLAPRQAASAAEPATPYILPINNYVFLDMSNWTITYDAREYPNDTPADWECHVWGGYHIKISGKFNVASFATNYTDYEVINVPYSTATNSKGYSVELLYEDETGAYCNNTFKANTYTGVGVINLLDLEGTSGALIIEMIEGETYKIALFGVNGGVDNPLAPCYLTTVEFKYESVFVLPEPPVKEHHDFVGWYLDEDLTIPFVDGTIITSDMDFYAKFALKQYKVTYVSNLEGVSFDAAYYDALSTDVAATAVDTVSHKFVGWYIDSACTQAYDPESELVGDTILYAKYSVRTYTLRFNVDGQLFAAYNVPYGTTLTEALEVLAQQMNLPVSAFVLPDVDLTAAVVADIELAIDEIEYGTFGRIGNWVDANWWIWIIVGVVALLIFAGIGMAINNIKKEQTTTTKRKRRK